MTMWALVVTAAVGGAEPERFGIDGAAAAVGTIITALGAAVVTLLKVVHARRANVSGDEREARRDNQSDRRDTIADRDSWIETLTEERDHARADRDNALAALDVMRTERDDARRDLQRCELMHEAAAMLHVPWDWRARQVASEAGVDLGEPPPLRPIPEEGRDSGER